MIEKERRMIHEIRKSERREAIGLSGNKNPHMAQVTPIKAQSFTLQEKHLLGMPLSKKEQELLRSMALTVEDNPWQRIQFTNKFNSLAPTYDPTALSVISYQNNTLRQCIAAMMANIDGTGYDIERRDGGKINKVVSSDSPPPLPPEKPPQPQTTGGLGTGAPPTMVPQPTPKPVPKVGEPYPPEDAAEPIMVDPPDVAKIKAFFDEPYPGVSFKTMREWLRDNLETTGNAYLEIIRDASGKIALLNPMDSKLTRLIRHDDIPVAVKQTVNRTGIPGDDQTVNILVHERRYVQIIGLNARFFKAYKATRNLNAQTGIWQDESAEEIQPVDNATEVLHFIVDRDVLTPYGIPRWINQMPSVMGSRKAEELNVEFFNHGGVPPVIIMIQGGTLSAHARRGLTDYLSGQAKYKQRGVVLEIAPSGGDLNSSAQVKVTTEKFGDNGDKDSKFEEYDNKCTQRIRSAFRLPAVLIGLEESYNYACYSSDTETLTDKGWVTADQFKLGMKVAQVNPETMEMTYVTPQALSIYDVENVKMYHYKSKQQDFMVTPNHRMLYRCDKGAYRIQKVEQMAVHSKTWTKRAVKWLGGTPLKNFYPPQKVITKGPYAYDTMMQALPAELFLQFLGWFVSEGHTHPYGSYSVITQHEDRGLSEIRTMVAEMEKYGYRVRESKLQRPKCWQVMIGDPSLVIWLNQNVGQKSETKRFPKWVLDLPKNQMQVVFDSLMAGDGSWVKNDAGLDSGSYASTSEALINQVQEMALKLGYATKRMNSTLREGRSLPLHRLAISKRDEGQLVTKLNLTRESYTGKVHCFTVPTGVYVTRRNGCVAIQGNTVQTAVMMAEEQVFGPTRDAFDEIINSTIMKEIDPTGIYVFKSKPMSVKFMDEQIKALTIVANGLAEPKSIVDAINDAVGLDLKFDQKAADLRDQQNQMSLQQGQGGEPQSQKAGLNPLRGTDQGGIAGTAGGGSDGFTSVAKGISKSSTALPGSSTAIDPNTAADVSRFRVQVTKSNKIKKLDHALLTDLAEDWAGLLTGERHFLGPQVEAMNTLVKSMTPALRSLFNDNVLKRVMNTQHDHEGARELVSCAGDVVARLLKTGGEPRATPKGLESSEPKWKVVDDDGNEYGSFVSKQEALQLISKHNPNHDERGRFSTGDGGGKFKNSDVPTSTRGTTSGNARISSPPIRGDGRIGLIHYSGRSGLTEISPKKYGTGLKGAEAKRKEQDPKNWVNRSYYGIAVGQNGGYQKEQGLGPHEYTASVKPSELYDLSKDPDSLYPKNGNISKYEKNIKQAGYKGYWVSHPQLGLTAAVFDPLKVESVEKQDVTEGQLAQTGGLLNPQQAGKAKKKKTWLNKIGQIFKDDPYHDPKTGEFTSGPGVDTDVESPKIDGKDPLSADEMNKARAENKVSDKTLLGKWKATLSGATEIERHLIDGRVGYVLHANGTWQGIDSKVANNIINGGGMTQVKIHGDKPKNPGANHYFGDKNKIGLGAAVASANSPAKPKEDKKKLEIGQTGAMLPVDPSQIAQGTFKELKSFEARDLNEPEYLKLNNTDLKAIKDYTGYAYNSLNKYLRGYPNLSQSQIESAKKLDAKLEQALGKTTVPENITVWRGLSPKAYKAFSEKMGIGANAVGKTFDEPAYMSTSISKSFAQSWGSGAVLKLKIPKGVHGLFVEPYSMNSSENEYLFQKGAKITITKHIGSGVYEGIVSY